MIWHKKPLFDTQEHEIPILRPRLASTPVRLWISKEQFRSYHIAPRGWTAELLESPPMPHVVILARTESRSGDEAIFWSYDLASEECRQIWVGVGQMLD